MLARSARFDAAFASGNIVAVYSAMLTRGGLPIRQLPSVKFNPGASITLDEHAACRRLLKADVADTGGLVPHLPADPLSPFGTELTLAIGLQYPDASQELLAAGIYRLQTSDARGGVISITGMDRSAVIAAALNEQPVVFPAGTYVDDAIIAYINSKMAGLDYVVTNPAVTHVPLPGPMLFQEGDSSGNPWQNCQDLALTVGAEVFFDPAGRVIIRPVPDPATTPPCWDYSPGIANLQTGSETLLDITGIPNVIVVEGASSAVQTPVRGTAAIDNPLSALYVGGPVGRRPKYISAANVTGTNQATQMALAALLPSVGLASNEGFTAVPNPAHEPGDVVHTKSAQSGSDAIVALSSWTLPVDLLAEVPYKTRRTV